MKARMIIENHNLKRDIQELRLELELLKTEMNKFKEFMNTKASFVDFKVFKFNEEEEKKQELQASQRISLRLHEPFDNLPF